MSHSVQNNNSQTSFNLNAPESLAFGTLVSSGLGAASAALFTSFSPLGGAVYGASYFLSGRVIDTICEKLSANSQHPAAKVARFAISTIGGIAAGAGITSLLGFSMSIATGAVITIGSLAIPLLAAVAITAGALAIAAIVSIIAMTIMGVTAAATAAHAASNRRSVMTQQQV